MPKFDSSLGQNLADQQSPVAIVVVALAADQCNPVATSAVDQAVDGAVERLLFGHRAVQSVASSVVMLLTRWAAAELLPHEEITDTSFSHRGRKLVAVEVRSDARVRVRPHVDDHLNALSLQKLRKVLKRVVGMPDRPDNP